MRFGGFSQEGRAAVGRVDGAQQDRRPVEGHPAEPSHTRCAKSKSRPTLNEKIDEKFMFELKLNIGDESFTLHHLDEDAGIAIKCGINFGSRDQNDVDRIKEAIFRKSQDVTAYEHQRRGLVEPGQKY